MEPAENIPYAKRIVERMSEVFEPPLNYTKYSLEFSSIAVGNIR